MFTPRIKAYTYLLSSALIWGIAGPIIKLTLKDLQPDVFLLYRFFIAALVALPIIFSSKKHWPKERKVWMQIIVYGILNSTICLGLLFWGTDKTSLLDMSLIELLGPIIMIFLGFFYLKDHITKREKIGSVIAFLGALLVAIEPAFNGGYKAGAMFGNMLIFLSILSGSISGYLVKKLLREGLSPIFLANLSFILGFVTTLPITILISGKAIVPSIVNLGLWGHLGVVYMGVISGTVAYALSNMGQKTIELSESAVFAYIYPVISAILAVILLGEKVSLTTITASIIIIVGVVIAELKKKRYNSLK